MPRVGGGPPAFRRVGSQEHYLAGGDPIDDRMAIRVITIDSPEYLDGPSSGGDDLSTEDGHPLAPILTQYLRRRVRTRTCPVSALMGHGLSYPWRVLLLPLNSYRWITLVDSVSRSGIDRFPNHVKPRRSVVRPR